MVWRAGRRAGRLEKPGRVVTSKFLDKWYTKQEMTRGNNLESTIQSQVGCLPWCFFSSAASAEAFLGFPHSVLYVLEWQSHTGLDWTGKQLKEMGVEEKKAEKYSYS